MNIKSAIKKFIFGEDEEEKPAEGKSGYAHIFLPGTLDFKGVIKNAEDAKRVLALLNKELELSLSGEDIY